MFKYILVVMIFSLGLTACSSSIDNIDKQVITPDGQVITPDGQVNTPDGQVNTPDGQVNTPDEPVITPAASALTMSFTPTKDFRFSWPAATNATYYELHEAATIGSDYDLIKKTTATSFDHVVPLYARLNAKYMLKSCNDSACTDSLEVFTSTKIAEMTSSFSYAKASNPEGWDEFGSSVSLSSDGNTLAVGAYDEDSNAKGIGGDENNNSTASAGAVYVFSRSGTTWIQQAYVKASNTGASDRFGSSVSLSSDGNTLAVGAPYEKSNARGIGGDEVDNLAPNAGAAYVFSRSDTEWTQQAYVKASNTDKSDYFGSSVSLSSDGNTLAVGAPYEDSNATGIGGDENNNSVYPAGETGAVYVFSRSDIEWTQQAYVKASNPGRYDGFGRSLSLSGDGNTLAVAASQEQSNATGIGGYEDDNSVFEAGAVYVFSRSSDTEWTQQAYVKASNTNANDTFGKSLSLSSDGNTLAVGAWREGSNATGINGDEDDNSLSSEMPPVGAGAVYVFSRSDIDWTQQAYVKASNPGLYDWFGSSVSLSSDGNTLAVGAQGEGSNATGIGGDEDDNSAQYAGAVYVFSRSSDTEWTQQAYVKATNTGSYDKFGFSVSLSSDGKTLAVGAPDEDSFTGAVYLY
jgi:predicted enzyme related to lactoylglutathione lyase